MRLHARELVAPNLRNSLLCTVPVLASILGTIPILEMGVNDDWSYAYIARQLASTGRLVSNGWAVTMIGTQGCWGALIIKLFGFSFTALRFSTSLFAIGCALLFYHIGCSSGLRPAFAVFGGLGVMLSPLMIPMSASFMTDVPAFFFLLGCLYWGLRAMQESSARRATLWIASSAAAGFLGGAIRQYIWGLPLLLIPAVAWTWRKDCRLLVSSSVIWAATAGASAYCALWFYQQPYTLSPTAAGLTWPPFAILLVTVVLACLNLLLVCLPVPLSYLFGWRRAPKGLLTWISGPLVFSILCAATLRLHLKPPPWLGNTLTPDGILFSGTEALGTRPVLLPFWLRTLLGLLVFAAAAACVMALASRFEQGATRRKAVVSAPGQAATPASLLLLAGPFSAGYLLLIAAIPADRYLIPLLPVVVIPLLWLYQEQMQSRVPAASWIALAVLAVYGTATTHDYLAAARARLAAASVLTRAGIPRTQVTAGIEYDGWTQLEITGYVNNGKMRLPPGARLTWNDRSHLLPVKFWFWDWTPNIEPRYFVTYNRQPSLVDAPFPPVPYVVWLPPSRRQVIIQMLPGSSLPGLGQ